MKSTFKYILGLALLAAGVTACDVSDKRATYTPDNDGVSFVQSVVTATGLDAATTTYSVDIARAKADQELTVSLTSAIYSNSDSETNLAEAFGVPSSVTFAAGEYKTEITFNVSLMEVGSTYTGTIAIAEEQDCYNPQSAISSISLTLSKAYNWVEIGDGQWYDGFLLASATSNNVQTVRMTKAEGFEIYRFYNPFPADVVAEAWGSDLTAGNDVPEYIEFSINEDGTVNWGNTTTEELGSSFLCLYTGYTMSGELSGPLYYCPVAVFGQPEDTRVVEDNLIQFFWAALPFPPSSGWTAYAYLALPDFQGNLDDLL